MKARWNVAFFGSSLVSAYWNGAATYYRGILKYLNRLGHKITFFEPDAFERQQHRDMEDPPYARVVVYPATEEGVMQSLRQARDADFIVKASGVGVFDDLLENLVIRSKRSAQSCIFWDVDAPATLERVQHDPADPFRPLIPKYDLIFTYGGGKPVVSAYKELGAAECVPVYNALDPETHHRVPPSSRFAADLAFLGNRMPDRESRVEEFFFKSARQLPFRALLLGGSGWNGKYIPPNVRYAGHVYTADHNAFNSTPLAVLNINRDSMARFGFSPATRIFEAAGAGASIITDSWEGIDTFLEPGREILVAANSQEIVDHLQSLTPAESRRIGEAALQRVNAEHTYAHRSMQVQHVLDGKSAAAGSSQPVIRHEERRPGSHHPLKVVIAGLSLTSSWGNGHATTYRALIRALAKRGHQVLFLERDVPWYASHRDMPNPSYCSVALYRSVQELKDRFELEIRNADLAIVGSYVPEGIEVGNWFLSQTGPMKAFYDIDTPVTLARLEADRCEYLSFAQLPGYDLYLSFTGGPTLDVLRKYGTPRPEPLYCSVDIDGYFSESLETVWDLGYLGTYSQDRQPTLNEFLLEPARSRKEFKMVVGGPQYPDSIEWPQNVERIRHIPPDQHRRFYNEARFTLNVTRADMIRAGFSPSVRLFEASACGVPIITDAWEGLDAFFKIGSEILVAHSSKDVLSYLLDMPKHERHAIGARARAACLARHTADVRAQELENYVSAICTKAPENKVDAETRRPNNSAAD